MEVGAKVIAKSQVYHVLMPLTPQNILCRTICIGRTSTSPICTAHELIHVYTPCTCHTTNVTKINTREGCPGVLFVPRPAVRTPLSPPQMTHLDNPEYEHAHNNMNMYMHIVMCMNIYISPANEEKLRSYPSSMSGLINKLLAEYFSGQVRPIYTSPSNPDKAHDVNLDDLSKPIARVIPKTCKKGHRFFGAKCLQPGC